MTTLNELLSQQAALDRQIAEYRRTSRAQAITTIRALMTEHGLTPTDLTARSHDAPGRSASKAAGRKVAAKYRDPASGATWSGRGLKPKWLTAALAGGGNLTDFAV